jgi:MtrB/PioB family decaheme-associated outer membrane protein
MVRHAPSAGRQRPKDAMKTSTTLLRLLSVFGAIAAADAWAADTSKWTCESCPFEKGNSGSVDVGAGFDSEDSAKFGDYTGLDRRGLFVLLGGSARHHDDDGYWGLIDANDLGLDSRSIAAQGGREGLYSLRLGYSEIPRHFSDTAVTPFIGRGGSVLTLPAGFPALDTSAMPLASTLQPADLGYKRTRFDAGAAWLGGEEWSYRVGWRRDTREGTQRTSGSFFSSASHLVAPLDQTTDRLELSTTYSRHGLEATLGYQLSMFRNGDTSLTWSNPFFPVVAGSTTGQLALAPDNLFHQINATAAYQISPKIRASGEIAWGRGLQDADYLAPTLTPGLAATVPPLPAQSLKGQADTFNANVKVTASPTERVHVNGSYARDVRDNRTASQSYPAVSTDMFLGTDPRINQPFSFIQDRFKLNADYRAPASITGTIGIDQDNRQRTFQEVVRTYDTTVWGRGVAKPTETSSLALKLAHSDRTNSGYGVATWVNPPENPLLRKFYLADRRRDDANLRADFTIAGNINVGLGAEMARDDYRNSTIGLTDGSSASLVGDVSMPIGEQTQLHAFAQGERIKSRQVGSQVFAQPDWSGRTQDDFYVGGVGIKHLTMKGRLELAGDLNFSRSRSHVTVDAGASAPPFPTATTSLDSLRMKATYRLKDDLSVVGSYWFEHYDAQDWRYDGVTPSTIPNLLAFGEQPPRYRVHVLQVALRYRF